MKKRPIIICLVVLVLGSVLFWLQSNYIITGWLNGEAFYQGRPTSYWRRDLENVICLSLTDGRRPLEKIFLRESASLRGWLDRMVENPSKFAGLEIVEDHPLWTGDPESRDVLTQLLEGATDTIREFAEVGLARIKQ
jgi:hypothetical protein